MPTELINGISIFYEEAGTGFPIVWAHEFAGDYRSWSKQVEFFVSRYRVITYNARGYPPSSVPTNKNSYSLENSVEDLKALFDHLSIGQAHVGGLSMGGSTVLNFGLRYPERVRSIIVAGTGTGSTNPEIFRQDIQKYANSIMTDGMSAMKDYSQNENRRHLFIKHPDNWQIFFDHFMEHSSVGSSLTFLGVQGKRAPVFELEHKLKDLSVPTLIMVGDDDQPCIQPSLFMKNCIRNSGLVIFPKSGHAINLEEPHLFNLTVERFLQLVESGKWEQITEL